jgi:hypothetical protein
MVSLRVVIEGSTVNIRESHGQHPSSCSTKSVSNIVGLLRCCSCRSHFKVELCEYLGIERFTSGNSNFYECERWELNTKYTFIVAFA